MADKNVQMKVLNSSGSYDSINPKSNAGLITTSDGNTVQDHVNNKNNPHGVTAEQVGALPDTTTTLPNPAALTISQGYGGQTGTYDGSAAKSISIPHITLHTSAPGTVSDGELWGVY